ncbi:MAG: hypothetical protein U1U88_001666 [Lawsonella clevelandensis]
MGWVLVSFLIGAIREYGDMIPNVEQWLTPYGKTLIQTSRNLCMPFSTVAGGGGLLKYMVKDGFFKSQTFKSMMQIAKDSSSFYYPGVPKAPTLIIHGTTDEILFQADQDKALWQRYCKAGTNTVYQAGTAGNALHHSGRLSPAHGRPNPAVAQWYSAGPVLRDADDPLADHHTASVQCARNDE